MKAKSQFVCVGCGFTSPKWLGRCSACSEWNTLSEEVIEQKSQNHENLDFGAEDPILLEEVLSQEASRISSGNAELDRVLGGGIVKGSLVLVGGDPGIGKSTLLLQVVGYLALQKIKTLYVSAEESLPQMKLRAQRLGIAGDYLYVLSETELSKIITHVEKLKPNVLIIDSVQTLYSEQLESAPGTVAQVRHCAARILYLAKKNHIATFLVGHVTKEGSIAGPRVLEHMVDTVLYFDSDPALSFRILRSIKNRFGSTNEIGVFEMQEKGLVEITNPSSFFLSERTLNNTAGSVVVSSLEGSRPFLIELQALVSSSTLPAPRRTTLGVDHMRVSLLLAVLEKVSGMHMMAHDVYVNVAGGVRIQETAADLGIILALTSSFKNKPIPSDAVILGEVGLSGEVRAVRGFDLRLAEAQKLGFKKCVLPQKNLQKLKKIKGVELCGISHIHDALTLFF